MKCSCNQILLGRIIELEERIIKLEKNSHEPRNFVTCDNCKKTLKIKEK
jgi:hypothetical protein